MLNRQRGRAALAAAGKAGGSPNPLSSVRPRHFVGAGKETASQRRLVKREHRNRHRVVARLGNRRSRRHFLPLAHPLIRSFRKLVASRRSA